MSRSVRKRKPMGVPMVLPAMSNKLAAVFAAGLLSVAGIAAGIFTSSADTPAQAATYHSEIPDTGTAYIAKEYKYNVPWIQARLRHSSACCTQTGHNRSTFACKITVNGGSTQYQGGCYESWAGNIYHGWYSGPAKGGSGNYSYITTIGEYAYYKLSNKNLTANWSCQNGVWWGVQNVVFRVKCTGWVELQKSSGAPNFVAGNSNYSLKGAQYTIYEDSACTKPVTTITTDGNGKATSKKLIPGTYYVKETKASKGYRLDPTKYTVTVPGGSAAKISSVEQPQRGKIKLTKKSAGAWSTSMDSYSLAGAKYEVRDASGKIYDTLVTDSSGQAISVDLPLGKYTVKEIVAPKNYVLNITPISVTINQDGVTQGAATSDIPVVRKDPSFGVKMDRNAYDDKHGYDAQGGGDLAAAEYELSFYDNFYRTAGELVGKTPYKVSKIRTTLVGGKALINITRDNQYLAAGEYGMPVGTYVLRETKAPAGYMLDPKVYIAQCTSDSNYQGQLKLMRDSSGVHIGLAQVSADQAIADNNRLISLEVGKRGDLAISKYIEVEIDPDKYPEGKKGVAGVQFQIINNNKFDVKHVEDGTWKKKGEVVYTITTDKDGFATTKRTRTADGYVGFENNADPTGTAPGTLPYGSYIIREVPETAPEGYRPIESYPVSISENMQYKHVILENQTGVVLRISKTDEGTGGVVQGLTKFRLLDKDKNVMTFADKYPSNAKISILTTDPDGRLFIPQKLVAGTYYIEEVEAAEGYLHSPRLQEIKLTIDDINDYDHPKEVAFADAPAKGKVILSKKDAETGRLITEAPATFEIRAAADIVTQDGTVRARKGDFISLMVTKDGIAESEELFCGLYEAIEVTAPNGYVRNHEPISFEIAYEGDKKDVADKLTYTNIECFNQPVKGVLSVEKCDALSHKRVQEAGVSFEVRAADNIIGQDKTVHYTKGEVIDTITTDETGTASIGNLPLGTYEVVEKSAPYGYVINNAPHSITLSYADQETPIVSSMGTVEDMPTEVDFDIQKLDRETAKRVLVAGCRLEIRAAEDIVRGDGTLVHREGDTVGYATTDTSGTVSTNIGLVCGKYSLHETNAPAGYILDAQTAWYVNAEWDGGKNAHVDIPVSVSNEPSKGIIAFKKVDASTGKTIEVAGIKAEVYADEDIITPDGTVRAHAGEKVAELTTGSAGAAATGELYLGKYRVIETFAPVGYLLNTIPTKVSLVYEGQEVLLSSAATTIADENAMGVIEIVKIDKETGKTVLLPDVVFEVRAKEDIITPDGTVRAHAGEIVDTVETDAEGRGSTRKLFLGTYTIKEVKAPTGYTLDETEYDAVLAYKDQYTAIVTASESITNTAQKGIISVTKTDAESGKPILKAGAVFEIKAVEDIKTADDTLRAQAGEIVDTIETDETGIAESKALYLGKYEVYETLAPEGHLLTDEVKQVELKYGDQTEPLVYEMTGLANVPEKGQITVHKEDSDLDEPLANVEYELRAKEDIITGDGEVHYHAGDVVETLITDENGQATSGLLYLGEYVLQETVQPNGYQLDEKEYPVHLEYAGQDIEVVHEDIELVNTPTEVVIEKISADDPARLVPNTAFVGWSASQERETDATFTVFADAAHKIKSASVDYIGEFVITGASANTDKPAKSFELAQVVDGEGYDAWVADESVAQGDYVMHLVYENEDEKVSCDVPFIVNEYDKKVIFALGDGVMPDGNEELNKFDAPNTNDDNIADDDPENTIKVIPPSNVEAYAAVENIATVAENSDENNNENKPVVDDEDENTSPDESTADDKDAEDSSSDDDEANKGEDDTTGNADADKPVVIEDVPIYRVPVALAHGKFAYSITDENGQAIFRHVPQGKTGFAEYEPAEGFVSDRTAGYVMINEAGQPAEIETDGNVSASKEGIVSLVFADDETRLTISKKDITTSEELPGNTLSVYEYVGTGSTGSAVGEGDYGELIETWVSTDKPHLMELLPCGTYILKEEQAVDGYAVAESIIFRLNDTGVEQQVVMNNEHEAKLADELVETGAIEETGDLLPAELLAAVTMAIIALSLGLYFRRIRVAQ